MTGLDRRITKLENQALAGPGQISPRFITEEGVHVSATMPGMGALNRGPNETNIAFEQRVFSAVREAASKGAIGYQQLSEDTLRACMGAGVVDAALDNAMVRKWFQTALDHHHEEGAQ